MPASACQRAGRKSGSAGEAEILQSDLSGLLMELLQWGCTEPEQLNWLDMPPAINLQAAKRLLQMLGALEDDRLSARGQKMAALGNDPRLAAMLVGAKIIPKRQRRRNWLRFWKSRRAVEVPI